MVAELVALRHLHFKSIREAEIPLGPLTVVAGRNGSGKSNIIDAIAVLTALADGTNLRDALDGGRSGPIVRGGSEGCAPLGEDSFSVGCTVAIGEAPDPELVHLDVTIQVRPDLRIIEEDLWTKRRSGPKRGEPRNYIKSDVPDLRSGDITVRWENGRRGVNPPVSMRVDELLTSQVATRVPQTSEAGRRVRDVADQVLGAIKTAFILDPVPHLMRSYVPEKDAVLRRNAENLSAVLKRLLRTESTRDQLLTMTRSLSEAQVDAVDVISSELGDVMVTLQEQIAGHGRPVSARLMSDGTLRFLAIAAAMYDVGLGHGTPDSRLLVVEEIENGLHPSQASLLIDRLKGAAESHHVRTLVTTHSPAVLNALRGSDHEYVVVASRDDEGWSRATRLTEFPDYFEVVSRRQLGDAAVADELRPREVDESAVDDLLSRIF